MQQHAHYTLPMWHATVPMLEVSTKRQEDVTNTNLVDFFFWNILFSFHILLKKKRVKEKPEPWQINDSNMKESIGP